MTPHRLDCLAACDIEDAARFYEGKRNGLGAAFRMAVADALKRIVAAPEMFPVLRSGIRRCLVRRFPYAVLFHFDGKIVAVLVVAHLQRQPEWWKARLAPEEGH